MLFRSLEHGRRSLARFQDHVDGLAHEVVFKEIAAVFGIGGVGSYAAEALVRSGLGTVYIYDKVDKSEANGLPAYNMHRSDFDLVQKRAVEVRADETGSYAIFAGLNNHYYRVVANDTAIEAFIPVDEDFADNGEAVADEERVATLTSIVDEYKDFFGFTYTQTEFTDATFIGDGTHDTFELSFTLGGNGEPAPSAEPSSEPTQIGRAHV